MNHTTKHAQQGFGWVGWTLAIPIMLILLAIGYFVHCEINKAYWDGKVDELCEKDGGISVHGEIFLSKKEYQILLNEHGELYIPFKDFANRNVGYYRDTITEYINNSNPIVWRSEYRIIRESDKEMLAVAVFYTRRGGDFPMPIHESSYSCPDPRGVPDPVELVFQLKE